MHSLSMSILTSQRSPPSSQEVHILPPSFSRTLKGEHVVKSRSCAVHDLAEGGLLGGLTVFLSRLLLASLDPDFFNQ